MREEEVFAAMLTARTKAWDALARYKYWMFGYHAAQWVLLNALLPKGSRQPNPFRPLVTIARDVASRADGKLRIRKVA